jgi:two-component system nitrate/nitrite response regulator NarL
MVSVYLISEFRLYRDAVERLLRGTRGIEIAGRAAHPLEAIAEVGGIGAEVVVLDVPGPEGPAWAARLRWSAPHIRIIAIGLKEAEREVPAWAEAGVDGYLGPEATPDELVSAIERVRRHGTVCSFSSTAPRRRGITLPQQDGAPPWTSDRCLTPREREILHLVGQGLSNRQIAASLFLALSTVKNHVHNILEKLGVPRRTDAVREVRRAGFIALDRLPAPEPGRPRLQLVSTSG